MDFYTMLRDAESDLQRVKRRLSVCRPIERIVLEYEIKWLEEDIDRYREYIEEENESWDEKDNDRCSEYSDHYNYLDNEKS